VAARRVAKQPTKHHEPTEVEAAETYLSEAEAALERWQRQAAQRAIDVADAERSLGQSVVDSTSASEPINKASTEGPLSAAGGNLATLRAEHEAAVAAVEATRKRIDKAQRGVWRAQAEEYRERATMLTAEADERQETTDRLLNELREFEGCDYGPTYVDIQQQVVMFGSATVSIPTTQRLRNEAAALVQQAKALELQAGNTPEARAEQLETERRARDEAIAATNEENRQRYLDSLPGRVVDTPLGV
jgi:hypothetical protein